MTKDEVEILIKRYHFINRAIKENLPRAEFYIGNRKQVIEIDGAVKSVCEIIEIIYESEMDIFIKLMIKGLMAGDSDKWLISHLPFSNNAYYDKKKAFCEKVYNCCISRGLVSLTEILMEKIA